MKYIAVACAVIVGITLVPATADAAKKAAYIPPPDTWEYNPNGLDIYTGSETQIEKIYKNESDQINVFRVANKRLYEDGKYSKSVDADDKLIWDMFRAVAGDTATYKNIAAYATFRLGKDSLLAGVLWLGKGDPQWALVVNANNASATNAKWRRDMVITLIHEYAHILTLTKPQADPKKNQKICEQSGSYWAEGHCAKLKSYLYAFYKKFWTPESVDEAEAAYERGSKIVYAKHEKDYLNWYAATGPAEDIAESFSHFILRKKPVGTSIAEQKILFFYDYPELVKMRTEMRSRIAKYFGY